MKEALGNEEKRILVLCVDRDGDLGAKAGIKTPVVGRENNLNAAVALALKDSEEPDANAMFEAVHIYDRLKAESKVNETLEVASLSGSELGGVSADRKVVAELSDLLDSFSATEVILVTDGYSDEAVLPVVQSRVPVSSVRRIVVKHSESIEETAALLSRYIRTLFDNPRYSRIVLGLPGVLILLFAAFSIFGYAQYSVLGFVLFLSAILLVKGFGVDRIIRNSVKWMREYSPPPVRVQISNFSALAGALLTVLGVYLGAARASTEIPPQVDLATFLGILPRLSGFFIEDAITLIVIGACIALLGRAIRWYLEHDSRLLRNGALLISIAWSSQIFLASSDLLTGSGGPERVVLAILIGILIGVASVMLTYLIRRRAKQFFKATEEQIEELGES